VQARVGAWLMFKGGWEPCCASDAFSCCSDLSTQNSSCAARGCVQTPKAVPRKRSHSFLIGTHGRPRLRSLLPVAAAAAAVAAAAAWMPKMSSCWTWTACSSVCREERAGRGRGVCHSACSNTQKRACANATASGSVGSRPAAYLVLPINVCGRNPVSAEIPCFPAPWRRHPAAAASERACGCVVIERCRYRMNVCCVLHCRGVAQTVPFLVAIKAATPAE